MTSSVGLAPLSEPVNDASKDMSDTQKNLKRRHDELGHDPQDPEAQRERKVHVAENITNGMPVSPTRKGHQDVNDPSKADSESTRNHAQNDDVAMADGTTHTSGCVENIQRNASSHTRTELPPSPSRKTGPKKPVVDGVAMVAAVAVAEAEAAAQKEAASSNGIQPSANGVSPPPAPHSSTNVSAASSGTAEAASKNSEPLSSTSLNFDNTPSTESIIRVAEAVVAAQEAAKAAKDSSNESATAHDPNLDPSLFSSSNTPTASASTAKQNGTSQSAAKPPSVNTAVASSSSSNQPSTSSSGSATPSTSSATTPSSTLSNNPYMSLAKMGALTPTHLMMPYPLFYAHPGTPVTPNTPSYPMPYNPYYYLASPLMASPGGVYPPIPPTTAAAAASSSTSASTSQSRPAAAPPAAEQPPKPKAKRTKTHAVTSKSFSIPVVPRDKNRKPMLPLNVGIMTVINLGVVCMREHFHSERYIFPVGYEVTRRYLSTIDPSAEVVYHCTILDGGDGPKFQIVPSDRPDKPVIAGTATGAWSSIVKQANHIRNRQHSNSVSGPDFFGLGQNTIKHLIQELPNADRLRDYVWQNFMEGGPLGGRHAAVIPALPEEYDSSLPLGAYYPKRDNSNPNVPRGMAHYPSHIIAQAEAERGQKFAAQGNGVNGASSVASGSGSSTPQPGPQHMQMQIQMQVQPTPPDSMPPNGGQPPLQIIPQNPGGPPTLNIQEYQPPQQQNQEPISAPQPIAQRQYTPERRATRSTNGINGTPNGSISAPVPSAGVTTPGRATRSSTRGAQKQNQQSIDQQQAQAQLQAHLLQQHHQQQQQQQQQTMQDGIPTTLAGVMQMYPTLSGVNMPSGTSS
ncbi:hypothetical protein CVT24_004793 [Panaeolus cyanescens]|uniref:FYR N-terminal domain-containing protein n=1 Tax=Panaeolus cyanescens TaxID=181874 RepID=A0A409VQ27_9AGAR|nr:hypothetical protein CVT24_004793 [Panaeolus cyanescens]